VTICWCTAYCSIEAKTEHENTGKHDLRKKNAANTITLGLKSSHNLHTTAIENPLSPGNKG
jgi:hypothetical protein